jgi:starch synthase
MLLYGDKKSWKKIQIAAMEKDFSWKNSAEQYLALYEEIC